MFMMFSATFAPSHSIFEAFFSENVSWWELNIPGGDAGSKALRAAATAATEAAHHRLRQPFG
jgi:hypothetical protein